MARRSTQCQALKKGAPRKVKGRLCGQRTNAGRIIKESYGIAKQQHTFTDTNRGLPFIRSSSRAEIFTRIRP
nr:unnamed protein product [Digitaria exilis]